MPALDVGLIGCGRLALGVHLPTLKRFPWVRLAALADLDPGRRAEAAARVPGAKQYEDYRELLQQPGLAGVVICLPPAQHAEAAVHSFQHGKHLYLEKPLAADPAEGEKIVAAWEEARTAGMIGFNYRFHPAIREAREILRSGVLGEVLAVQSEFSTCEQGMPNWKRRRASGGGVLLDLASHHIDLARFLLEQEISEVSCRTLSHRSEGDAASLRLRMSRGALVQTFVSLVSAEEDQIRVFGTAGALRFDRYRNLRPQFVPLRRGRERVRAARDRIGELRSWPLWVRKALIPGYEPSYAAALGHFFRSIREERPAAPDLRDGYASLAVVAAAEKAAEMGGTVTVRPMGF